MILETRKFNTSNYSSNDIRETKYSSIKIVMIAEIGASSSEYKDTIYLFNLSEKEEMVLPNARHTTPERSRSLGRIIIEDR